MPSKRKRELLEKESQFQSQAESDGSVPSSPNMPCPLHCSASFLQPCNQDASGASPPSPTPPPAAPEAVRGDDNNNQRRPHMTLRDVMRTARRQASWDDGNGGHRRPEGELARLITERGGRRQILVIQSGRPFVVGRHFACDYVVPDLKASAKHFKLFAQTTDSGDSFVSCDDLSTNGLMLNGKTMPKHAVVLNDGDVISIPGSQTFTYEHTAPQRDGAKAGEAIATKTIGRFTILDRVLGTGTYAHVLLAFDNDTGRQVACKREAKTWLAEEQGGVNLMKEVELLRRLNHPNVNSLLGVEEDDEFLCGIKRLRGSHGFRLTYRLSRRYLCVEIVAGSDLFNYVALHKRLSDAEAKFIFFQMAVALQYLHAQGIAHRDVKPENVLLLSGAGAFPHIQLADFGLAFQGKSHPGAKPERGSPRKAIPPSSISRSQSACGTVTYLSPAALRSRATGEPYDPYALDIWAAGCVLFIMLRGHHPFDDASIDTLDELVAEVQHYLVERRLASRSDLISRGLFQPLAEDDADPGVQQAVETKIRFVRNVFRGLSTGGGDLSGLKPQALTCLQGCLAVEDPSRLTIGQVLTTSWLTCSGAELQAMYEARIRTSPKDPDGHPK